MKEAQLLNKLTTLFVSHQTLCKEFRVLYEEEEYEIAQTIKIAALQIWEVIKVLNAELLMYRTFGSKEDE